MTHTSKRVGGRWWMLFVVALAFPPVADAQNVRPQKDIVYVTVGGKALALDLYMPAGVDCAAPGRLDTRRALDERRQERRADGVCRSRHCHGQSRFPAVHRGALSGDGPRHQGGDPISPREGARVWVSGGSDRHRRDVVGGASGDAGRRDERPQGARGHARRSSKHILECPGDRQLLRRLESHDHPRAVHAVWRRSARARARGAAGRDLPIRRASWRSSPVLSHTWTARTRRSCSCTAIRIRRCPSTSPTRWKGSTSHWVSTCSSTSCTVQCTVTAIASLASSLRPDRASRGFPEADHRQLA